MVMMIMNNLTIVKVTQSRRIGEAFSQQLVDFAFEVGQIGVGCHSKPVHITNDTQHTTTHGEHRQQH